MDLNLTVQFQVTNICDDPNASTVRPVAAPVQFLQQCLWYYGDSSHRAVYMKTIQLSLLVTTQHFPLCYIHEDNTTVTAGHNTTFPTVLYTWRQYNCNCWSQHNIWHIMHKRLSCSCPHHKTLSSSGGTTPLILNLDTIWRTAANFMTQVLYPWVKRSHYPLHRWLRWFQTQYGHFGEKRNPVPCQKLNPGSPTHSTVIIQTTLSQLCTKHVGISMSRFCLHTTFHVLSLTPEHKIKVCAWPP